MLSGPLVFLDIDTQRDFMEPGGALHVERSSEIVPNLGQLTQYATRVGIPIIATACSHKASDPELLQFPPHCMAGTPGQERIRATAGRDSLVLSVGTPLRGELPAHLTLEKSEYDVFSRSDAAELIARYNEHKPLFVVYGVATDYCVKKAVEGLLALSCRAAIVVDAIRPIDPAAEPGILTDFARRGVLLALTRVVCAGTPA
jgi:nicotinamidase/pyrazinamidase